MGEQEIKQNRHTALKFFLVLIIFGSVAGAIYLKSTGINIVDFILAYQSENTTPQIVDTIKFDINSKSSFAIIKDSYVQCTKDGVKYNGSIKWNETYTMASPVIISEGNIVAVGEFNSKDVYVLNEKGKMYNIVSDEPILQFAINRLGYLLVLTKDTLNVYNESGKPLTKINIGVEGNFPISADISNDGKFIALSCLDTIGNTLLSKILFYGIGADSEAEYGPDSLVGSIEVKEHLVFNVSYMKDDTLISISDSEIIASKSQQEIWRKSLKNKLDCVDFGDGSIVALGLGTELPGGSEYEYGTAIWYDLNGNLIGQYETGKEIKMICSKGSRVLIHSGKSIYGITKKGRLIWEHIVLQDIEQLMLFDNLSNMLVVYRNSAEIINIKPKLIKTNENPSSESNELESVENTSGETESSSEIESNSETENSTEQDSNDQMQNNQDQIIEETSETTDTETEQ